MVFGFYRVTAYKDMSSYSDVIVKEFLSLDNAYREAAEQLNDWLNEIPYAGELDEDHTDWETYNGLFQFYGVSRDTENYLTIHVEGTNFEDLEELVSERH